VSLPLVQTTAPVFASSATMAVFVPPTGRKAIPSTTVGEQA